MAYDEEQIRVSLSRIVCGHVDTCLAELIILSTCNRIEFYAVSNQLSYVELENFLSAARGVPVHDFHAHLYRFADLEAARHLFDVAAGLDSLVLGEPQILGQITRALELARGQNAAGPTLNRLFQAAIHAGKRARTETAISRNSASVSSLAVSVAAKTIDAIQQAKIVVLGAGEMAELTVESLRKRGAQHIQVVNRTLEGAQELAQRWGAQAETFEALPDLLRRADILISSTGAPHFVISAQMVAAAMGSRAEHPSVLIDTAVPRDIDPGAGKLPGVQLLDLDDLNAQLEDSLSRRMDEVPHVRQILRDELAAFEAYWKSLDMLPLIAEIRQQAEAIRVAELEKTLRRLPDLTDTERERIEALTQALVRKLLDHPTRRLREEAISHHAPEYAAMARVLFNLSGESLNSPSTALIDGERRT